MDLIVAVVAVTVMMMIRILAFLCQEGSRLNNETGAPVGHL